MLAPTPSDTLCEARCPTAQQKSDLPAPSAGMVKRRAVHQFDNHVWSLLTMKIVGLSGGIATGKSTFAAELRTLGFPVIDSDDIAKLVVKKVNLSRA